MGYPDRSKADKLFVLHIIPRLLSPLMPSSLKKVIYLEVQMSQKRFLRKKKKLRMFQFR